MGHIIKEIPLANGLTIRFRDLTRQYFGDFYLVKIEITCEVPLSIDLFSNATDLEDARRLVGDSAIYYRTAEKMGVPSTAIGTVVERLIGTFSSHSLPYFASPGFPSRFVRAELAKMRRNNSRATFSAIHRHD
ncbi:MAG: hypothetical protein ED859_09520 [Desulfuromonadales bacterium]|nr:MAG: hypothetical protein ED859_09520 [Desulfuromonadales bacterium]